MLLYNLGFGLKHGIVPDLTVCSSLLSAIPIPCSFGIYLLSKNLSDISAGLFLQMFSWRTFVLFRILSKTYSSDSLGPLYICPDYIFDLLDAFSTQKNIPKVNFHWLHFHPLQVNAWLYFKTSHNSN